MNPVAHLTPRRLFGDPPLAAALPQKPTYVEHANGASVFFLHNRVSEREVLELWRYDCYQPGSAARPWLSAEDVAPLVAATTTPLSEVERAERERLRLFATGITSYLVRPEHDELLVAVNGQAVLITIGSGAGRRVTTAADRHSAFRFSPRGRYLSYVRQGDLFVLDLIEHSELRVTEDANDTVHSGLADFIAQEEMHRFSGHWWHPEEQFLAFQRTDERPIPIAHRYDIQADQIQVIEQRYPYAGGPNADVRLGVFKLDTRTTTWLPYQQTADDYLARVDWLGSDLWVQAQSRDQQRLTLLRYADGCHPPTTELTEHSSTWINLHDNLQRLSENEFCWTSERSGCRHLYVGRRQDSGEPAELLALTEGEGYVGQTHCYADGVLWFSGWLDTPTEQHLYQCVRSDAGWSKPQQITRLPGWHQCTLSADGRAILDVHSSLTRPPGLLLLTNQVQDFVPIVSGEITQGHPYYPFLAKHQTPILGTLPAADGTTLHYRLTPPSVQHDAEPVPAIVYVYGGPGPQLVKNEWAPLLLQLLSSAGYAVFQLDNRGSGGRGRHFEAGIYRGLGTVEVLDQLQGVAYLQSLDWIAAERIGVFGHSYGGYMTLRCLSAAPEVFAAGVSVAPVTDWRLYDTHYTERYLGTPTATPATYASASVLGNCQRLCRPLLLMHGMADDNVLFANTTALLAELQLQGTAFELMTYPGSKHALQEPHVASHRFEMLLAFFDRHLKSATPKAVRAPETDARNSGG